MTIPALCTRRERIAFATLVLPQYAELVSKVAFPLEVGELPIIFWLLIWGAKTRPIHASAA
jgi:hypothetical protein